MIYKDGVDLNFVKIYEVKCKKCGCEFITKDKLVVNEEFGGYSHFQSQYGFGATSPIIKTTKGFYCENCGELATKYTLLDKVRPNKADETVAKIVEQNKENELERQLLKESTRNISNKGSIIFSICLLFLIILVAGTIIYSNTKQPTDTHTHIFSEQVPIERYFAAPATCTHSAKYYYSCKCGESSSGCDTFEFGGMTEHIVDPSYSSTYSYQCLNCQQILPLPNKNSQ